MESILPTEEYTEVDGRAYLNPQVGLDESNAFIDNLRATQGQQNQEIFSDTQRLGTDIPTNLGGLTGANSYFTSRYQTPQTNAAVANLRATAQAKALNDVLANEQAIWKKRYQDAYRNYQKRQASSGGGTSGFPGIEGGVDETDTTSLAAGSGETFLSNAYSGTRMVTDAAGNLHVIDLNTGDEEVIAPGASSTTRTGASAAVGGGTLRTLPNGNRVLVKPGYALTKDNGRYYLVNSSTGNRTEVGG